ncbi:hypothetical protein GCM10010530_19320 [Kribbella aluminosa]
MVTGEATRDRDRTLARDSASRVTRNSADQPGSSFDEELQMEVKHRMIVFDAADIDSESSFWAGLL